jgi:hypothetical protein
MTVCVAAANGQGQSSLLKLRDPAKEYGDSGYVGVVLADCEFWYAFLPFFYSVCSFYTLFMQVARW